jgi:cobyrinic acid a,c-diamide synthase
MVGIFPFETAMQQRRSHLGYREIRLKESCILGRAEAILRGHEFHYSNIPSGQDMKESGVETIYDAVDAQGRPQECKGYRIGQVLASYVHVHFASNQRSARHFINFIKENTWSGQS